MPPAGCCSSREVQPDLPRSGPGPLQLHGQRGDSLQGNFMRSYFDEGWVHPADVLHQVFAASSSVVGALGCPFYVPLVTNSLPPLGELECIFPEMCCAFAPVLPRPTSAGVWAGAFRSVHSSSRHCGAVPSSFYINVQPALIAVVAWVSTVLAYRNASLFTSYSKD